MDTNHEEMLAAGPGIKSISIHNELPREIAVNVLAGEMPPRPTFLAHGEWKTFEPSSIPILKPGMLWSPVALANREIHGAAYPYNPNGEDIYFNVKFRNPLDQFDIILEQTSDRP
jgi:hypothetical protein